MCDVITYLIIQGGKAMTKYDYDSVLLLLEKIGIAERYSAEFKSILDADNAYLLYLEGADIPTNERPISYYFSSFVTSIVFLRLY